MMKARPLACLIAFGLASLATAAEKDHPYRHLVVGDFATYKVTNSGGGVGLLEGTISYEVTGKTHAEVTLQTSVKFNGVDSTLTEQRVDLTKPYEPEKAALPAGSLGTLEVVKTRAEKVTVGGKN